LHLTSASHNEEKSETTKEKIAKIAKK
jgi:hypothetical protein